MVVKPVRGGLLFLMAALLLVATPLEAGRRITAEQRSVLERPWSGQSWVERACGVPGCRLEVPDQGYLLDAKAHQGEGAFLRVWALRGELIEVNISHNPSGGPIQEWFDSHRAFLARGEVGRKEGQATRADVPAILLERASSPQAKGAMIAIFQAGDYVFQVTCLSSDDEEALRVFDHMIRTLAVD